jgi:hypothetical protein
MSKSLKKRNNFHNDQGFVLLVTLVLLVVLSMLGYTLSTRVAAQRHRQKYIIDYSSARYGCDSAVKYALATLEEIDPQLISRPNEPDFSDLFYLTPAEYQELLEQWGLNFELTMFDENSSREKIGLGEVDEFFGIDEFNDTDVNETEMDGFDSYGDVKIAGPYGPAWPYVTEPVEFEIGSAKVRIEIQDENAKYPLGWAMLDDNDVKRETEAGFEIFCEMNGLTADQIESLKIELEEIEKIKPFAVDFKPITRTVRKPVTSRSTNIKSRTSKAPTTRVSRQTVKVPDQIAEQTTHFAKIFHSSLIDTEILARPVITGPDDRSESALKYMGMWGSMKVNINTAPRHVLEAAFIFGGDEVKIAEEIIQRRRVEPFSDFQTLKTELFKYSNSLDKCEKYITTVSRFFTIKVTAVSGVAKASTVIAITKDGQKVQRVAVING